MINSTITTRPLKRRTDLPPDERQGLLERVGRLLEEDSTEAVERQLGHEGYSAAEAAQLVAEAKRINAKRAKRMEASVAPPSERLTDIGNAKRLVRRHGDEFRYVSQTRSSLVWNGKVWASRGAAGAVERFAQDTAAGIYQEAAAAGKAGDSKAADALAKWAAASSSTAKLEAMRKEALLLGRVRCRSPLRRARECQRKPPCHGSCAVGSEGGLRQNSGSHRVAGIAVSPSA